MSRPPALLGVYRALTGAIEPIAGPLLSARARRGKEDPARLAERLGRPGHARPAGALAWLHGASVGESLSLLPLIEALSAARPELSILVTSGTVTSAELLAQRLPTPAMHQYAPVDAPRAAARFLDHWRPDLAVFVESEIWPNLLVGARARGVPAALVSARLSQASLAQWRRAPGSARALLSGFQLVMAQDDAAAAALARLGARDDGRLNLKLAAPPLPVDEAALARAKTAAAGRAVLLAASTHEGEEAIALDAFSALADRADRPLLVLVPRHPARGETVAAMAEMAGFAVRREGAGQAFDGLAPVHVADRLGELGLWFRLAAAALVGGSLVPGVGGHNPLEPARLDAPILAGGHVDKWAAVYADLAAVDGWRRVEPTGLARAWAEILDDPGAARASAARARAVAEGGAGRLGEAVTRLAALAP